MMKKLLVSLIFFLCWTKVGAQDLVSTQKLNRTVVLEDFTGVRCGYCPEGHVIAADIKKNSPVGSVILINIHVGPFASPMDGYPDFTTPFGDGLRELAIVSSYPSATVNRHKFDPAVATTGLSRNAWANAAAEMRKTASPVNVGVQSTFDPATRLLTVNVEGYYTDDVKEKVNYVHVVLKESKIIAIQSDYTNGTQTNYSHDNMLRHMLTGLWGDTINSPKKSTLVKKQYTYTVPDSFNIENCEIAAFISQTKQEIYSGAEVKANGGKTIVLGTLTTQDNIIVSGTKEQEKDFTFTLNNAQKEKSTLTVSLISQHPKDWKSQLGAETGTTTIKVDMEPAQDYSIPIKIIPGASAAVGHYTLKVTSDAYPEAFELRKDIYVIANADELLINHVDAQKFEEVYVAAIKKSGSVNAASTSADILADLMNSNALTSVKTIYYNVSWSFPAMSDNTALALQSAIDEGVHLFIAGQDIAWDIGSTDTRAHGTPVTKSFLRNYMNALYISDGDSTITEMSMNIEDPIFGDLGKSSIIDVHNKNLYPEVVRPLNGAYPIMQYEGNHEGKIGGIRSDNHPGKVVYLGIGLEQLANKELADNIVKRSRDWFAGIVSVNEDISNGSPMITPVPVLEAFTINLPFDGEVIIVNSSGEQVAEFMCKSTITIPAVSFSSGIYTVIAKENGGTKTLRSTFPIIR
jgi:hypothetical protein